MFPILSDDTSSLESTRHQGRSSATVSKTSFHRLAAHDASPAIARAHVARLINGRGAPEQRGVATLIVSELVTNAVIHGREPIYLELQIRGDALHIEVYDADANAAGVVPPSPRTDTNAGGRGLRIVDVLAQEWGVKLIGRGKAVWAAVALPPAKRPG
jgi:anti-sigma regulatory factor (Ser/Thr protein kinase)